MDISPLYPGIASDLMNAGSAFAAIILAVAAGWLIDVAQLGSTASAAPPSGG